MANSAKGHNFRTQAFDNGRDMRDWWGCSVYWANGLRQRTKCNPATAHEFVALLLEQGARLVVLDGKR